MYFSCNYLLNAVLPNHSKFLHTISATKLCLFFPFHPLYPLKFSFLLSFLPFCSRSLSVIIRSFYFLLAPFVTFYRFSPPCSHVTATWPFSLFPALPSPAVVLNHGFLLFCSVIFSYLLLPSIFLSPIFLSIPTIFIQLSPSQTLPIEIRLRLTALNVFLRQIFYFVRPKH